MKLLIIIGNTSVGKMTVGQELMKITDFRLFQNHMSVELVMEVFGERITPVDTKINRVILEEFARSDRYGLIFTYMWAPGQQADWGCIKEVCEIFKQVDAELYLVDCMNNDEDIPFENYLKIDNSELSPEVTAWMIKEKFEL
jgi:hypothetical protein